MIKENDCIELTENLPKYNLLAGQSGVVIEHLDDNHFDLEFMDKNDNFTIACNISVKSFKKLNVKESNVKEETHNFIQLHSGIHFYPTKPDFKDISIEDLAHSLSFICRFNGHCKFFYSVAQHCLLVNAIVTYYSQNTTDQLWALLHDAPEGLGLNDIVRPIKQMPFMSDYKTVEANLMQAVCNRFSLPLEQPKIVKLADEIALAMEAKILMNDPKDWQGLVKIPKELIERQIAEKYIFECPMWRVKNWFIERFEEIS